MAHGEEGNVVEEAAPVSIDSAGLQEDGIERPKKPCASGFKVYRGKGPT